MIYSQNSISGACDAHVVSPEAHNIDKSPITSAKAKARVCPELEHTARLVSLI